MTTETTILHYDLYGATLAKNNTNAWKYLQDRGATILRSDPFPIGDCIVFEVTNCPKKLPKYITIKQSHNFRK